MYGFLRIAKAATGTNLSPPLNNPPILTIRMRTNHRRLNRNGLPPAQVLLSPKNPRLPKMARRPKAGNPAAKIWIKMGLARQIPRIPRIPQMPVPMPLPLPQMIRKAVNESCGFENGWQMR